ncbi:MAG: YIP1 family protein [Clostridia bacterium]|nr:YIP1 family protein [Clostridia bacterium]
MKRKIIVCLIAVLFIFQTAVSAASPYQSYVYDSNGNDYPAPDAMIFDKSIDLEEVLDAEGNPVGRLYDPQDIYLSPDNLIYVSDTYNHRIVVLNSDFTFNRVIDKFTNVIVDKDGNKTEIEDTFFKPEGTFVDREGNLYVCDTYGLTATNCDASVLEYLAAHDLDESDNIAGRVVQFDKTGKFVRTICQIESPVLPEDFYFVPTKITVDGAGRIFILSKGFNMGVIELNKKGEFMQCLGAPKVTPNIVELIWRMFSTEEQRKGMQNFVPTEYNNIDIDNDDFLYVTSLPDSEYAMTSTDALRKLSAKGKDVLKRVTDGAKPYGDVINVLVGAYKGPSLLYDVIAMDNEMYAILDGNRNKVFFYNSEGINLFQFGCPPDNSDPNHISYISGTLKMPRSIEWLDGQCLVLDSDLKTINVFKLTDYGELIMKATKLHHENKYDEENEVWKEVLKFNSNSAAAKQSLGKVAYRNGDYKTAMKYFKETKDTLNFSKAYKYDRRDIISKYFDIAIIVAAILIVLIIVGSKLGKKYLPPIKSDSYLGKLGYAKKVIFRPLNGYWALTRENHSSVATATTILLAAAVVSLLQTRFTGFIFSPEADKTNVFLELLKIIGPALLFCVCNWCVTSLLNGEGNFKSIYIATSYALTPIIILYPIALIFSNVMVKEEGDFYTVFVTIALLWVLMLIVAGNMRIHDYSLGMTIVEMLITVVVMLIVVFLAVLFFALLQQMYSFVLDIINEVATRS